MVMVHLVIKINTLYMQKFKLFVPKLTTMKSFI